MTPAPKKQLDQEEFIKLDYGNAPGVPMLEYVLQAATRAGHTKVDIPRVALPPVLQYLLTACDTRPDSEVEVESKRQFPELELTVEEGRKKLRALALGVALGVTKMVAEPGPSFPPLVNADLLFRATQIAKKKRAKLSKEKKLSLSKRRAERKKVRAQRKRARR